MYNRERVISDSHLYICFTLIGWGWGEGGGEVILFADFPMPAVQKASSAELMRCAASNTAGEIIVYVVYTVY